jgi:TonB-linked SusC/RagA family outer membrane protein
MRSVLSIAAARVSLAAVVCASLVAAPNASAQDATGTITGRVTDARSGAPIEGASIEVSSARIGSLSSADGQFRIAGVPAGPRLLIVRRIGFAVIRREVVVNAGQETTADFALDPSAIALDAVLITGTASGGQRRTIGNSVATVNAPDELAKSSAPDLGSLLSGRVAGTVISSPSGRLGAGSAIQIRGRSSIGLGNSPLVYIDGVRVTNTTGTGPSGSGFSGQGSQIAGRLNDIAPEDIESIEVIKGPAAATIYGTEASNGVVQIITRRGSTGEPQFSLSVSGGPIWFRDAENRMPTNFAKNSAGEIIEWNAVRQEEERGTPLFETGQTRQVSGAWSGARNEFRYYLSGLYQKDEGIEPNNSNHQFSLHANLDLTPAQDLTIATSLNYVDLRAHLGVDNGASAMFASSFGHSVLFPNARGFGLNFVPEVTQELWDNSQDVTRFTASTRIQHDPFAWFTQRGIIGVDYTGDDSRNLERFVPADLAPLVSAATAAGRIRQTLRRGMGITADYAGTARFDLTNTITSATSVGGQLFRSDSRASTLGGTGFPGAGIETVSGVAVPESPSQQEILNTTIGAYAEQKFGWRERLFLTGAVRVDNNSAFGEDFKWVTYPKVDASWIVSDESFWPFADKVRSLRLRAAYGESGRQPPVFSALKTFVPVQGPSGTSAVTPGSIGNPDLKPERGREIEAGFEAEVLDRLSLDFTYFSKKTEDEIINQSIAPSTGFAGSRPMNLGRVDNGGIELAATVRMIERSNFDWQMRATFATNQDEIKDLGGVPSVISAFGQFNKVGYPIGGYYARRVVSADRATNGTATNVLCDGGPGQPAVTCTQAPFLFIGTPTPKRSGAIANTVNIGRRIRLFALVDFKQGNKVFNATKLLRCTGALGAGLCESNYRPEKYDLVYLAQTAGNALSQGIVDHYVEDAGFMKLREISAAYTLPDNWIPGASNATFTLAARELKTWTNYTGLDPETSLAGSGGTNATDQALVPPLTRIFATLSIRF